MNPVCTSCASVPEFPNFCSFLVIFSVLASIALGVFNNMGNKPCSVSEVRGVDAASRKYERLNFVAFSFQVSVHLLEYQSFYQLIIPRTFSPTTHLGLIS